MLPIVRRARHNLERRRRNHELILMRREIRERYDPFALPDQRNIELFRLNKAMVGELVDLIRPHMQSPLTIRGISVEQKLLVALRFYATGAYQRGLGEEYNFGMSQASVHFCIHQVTDTISDHLVDRFIRFPVTVLERNTYKHQFLEMFGFPGTIGAVDGTHIAILKPGEAEEQNFFNRKGFHSINCQMICNAHMKILGLFANYGGATHSFIWNNSRVKVYLENNLEHREQAWLIGDSGYPQSRVLMTTFLNPPEGTAEARYNRAHIRARNVIERTIGVWKMRFRCISKERTARYEPRFVCKLAKTCAVLHNICVVNNVPLPAEREFVPEDQPLDDIFLDNNPRLRNEGILARQRLVQRYFRNQ